MAFKTADLAIISTTDDISYTPGDSQLSTLAAQGFGGAAVNMGLRFQGLQVPQGAQIASAVLLVSNFDPNSSASYGYLYGLSSDNAPILTPSLMGGPRTKARSALAVVAGASIVNNIDVTSIVREITARAGWAQGNDLAFIGDGTGSPSIAYFRDNDDGDGAQLIVVYDDPNVTAGPPQWLGNGAFGPIAATMPANFAVPLPATRVQGGRLILRVETALNQPIPAPAGWGIVASAQTAGTTLAASTTLQMFTKEVDGSEVPVTIANPGNHFFAVISSYTPCDIDVVAASSANAASTTCNFPGATSTAANILWDATGTSSTDVGTPRASAWTNGFTERGDGSTTSGNGGGIFFATKEQASPGPVGATQCTLATSTQQARMMIALVPKAGAVTPVARPRAQVIWIH